MKGTPYALSKQVAMSGGAVEAGAQLYFYETGTTTDQTVYDSSDLSSAHNQPVVANSNGEFPPIYLDPDASVDYRVRLNDSDDALIWQEDDVPRYRENFESGSFSVSWVGFSADPSNVTANWYRMGSIVSLDVPLGTGTSNSTGFSFTGLPAAIRPDTIQYCHLPFAEDNGSVLTNGAVAQIQLDGDINFAPADAAFSTTGWTSSSTKGILTSPTCVYRLRSS
jgi:hypothetical protein